MTLAEELRELLVETSLDVIPWLADSYIRRNGPALLAALEDAERYRTLKRHVEYGTFGFVYGTNRDQYGIEDEHYADDGLQIDALIDAARKEEK